MAVSFWFQHNGVGAFCVINRCFCNGVGVLQHATAVRCDCQVGVGSSKSCSYMTALPHHIPTPLNTVAAHSPLYIDRHPAPAPHPHHTSNALTTHTHTHTDTNKHPLPPPHTLPLCLRLLADKASHSLQPVPVLQQLLVIQQVPVIEGGGGGEGGGQQGQGRAGQGGRAATAVDVQCDDKGAAAAGCAVGTRPKPHTTPYFVSCSPVLHTHTPAAPLKTQFQC